MHTVYEVRVEVEPSIAEEYFLWLKRHMADLVQAAGFEKAVLFSPDEPTPDKRVWVVQYLAPNRESLENYLTHLAHKFRADGLERFGNRFQATRQILNFQLQVPDLTARPDDLHIVSIQNKGGKMTTQVNWQKIRSELQRLSDVEQLKSEVHRIGSELRKFDYHSVLSPSAQAKVKQFEKRYSHLMRSLQQAQRQMDREFNRILKQIKGHRTDVTRVVAEQRSKLEKVSSQFKKRFTKKAAGAKKAATQAVKRAKTPVRKKRKA